jgi:hypothetical protein
MATPLRTSIKEAIKNLNASVQFPTSVNGHSTWVVCTRRLLMFNKIDPAAQPQSFIVQHHEDYEDRGAGLPSRRIMNVGIWCFAWAGGDGVVGDDLLDSMMEGIEAIFPSDPGQSGIGTNFTLGGLCYDCRIERRSNMLIRDPGDIEGQALLIVPIRVVMP